MRAGPGGRKIMLKGMLKYLLFWYSHTVSQKYKQSFLFIAQFLEKKALKNVLMFAVLQCRLQSVRASGVNRALNKKSIRDLEMSSAMSVYKTYASKREQVMGAKKTKNQVVRFLIESAHSVWG